MEILTQLKARINVQIDHLIEDMKNLEDIFFDGENSMIIVEDTAFEGVIISTFTDEYHVPPPDEKRMVYKMVNKRILAGGFNPADPPPFPLRSKEEIISSRNDYHFKSQG